jgi:hypothetical protein
VRVPACWIAACAGEAWSSRSAAASRPHFEPAVETVFVPIDRVAGNVLRIESLQSALEEVDHFQVILGENRGLRSPSFIPLRGLCLIGYYTLMRPKCNRFLTWEEVTLDPANRTGWYQLDKHKNVNKGIKARGPLAAELARAARLWHRDTGLRRSGRKSADPHPLQDAHGRASRIERMTLCRPTSSRAQENGVHLRVCAVRAFSGAQRAFARSSSHHAGRRPAADRRPICVVSSALFPWNTRSEPRNIARFRGGFRAGFRVRESRPCESACELQLSKPTRENTKATEVAAGECFSLAGPTGSNPRPSA